MNLGIANLTPPKFSGLQLIQIHGDNSPFKDHVSMRFVDYTPQDQVDLFNDKAWGNHSPGENGKVIDNPTARYNHYEVELLSRKIGRGEIPTLQEAKAVIQNAIEAAPVDSEIKTKFAQHLEKASYLVRATHKVWDQWKFVITGYYGPAGKLVGTHGNEENLSRLPEQWEPDLLNRFSPSNDKKDQVYIAFDTVPFNDERYYLQPQS